MKLGCLPAKKIIDRQLYGGFLKTKPPVLLLLTRRRSFSGHCERFVVSSTGHWTQGFNDLSLLLA